jgi:hypothetical protein
MSVVLSTTTFRRGRFFWFLADQLSLDLCESVNGIQEPNAVSCFRRNFVNGVYFMSYRKILAAAAIIACASYSMPVLALDNAVGHVTMLEPTYMPGTITFTLDVGILPECPAGTCLNGWAAHRTKYRGIPTVYATLLAALESGKQVQFFINNGDNTCTGQFIHILPN